MYNSLLDKKWNAIVAIFNFTHLISSQSLNKQNAIPKSPVLI